MTELMPKGTTSAQNRALLTKTSCKIILQETWRSISSHNAFLFPLYEKHFIIANLHITVFILGKLLCFNRWAPNYFENKIHVSVYGLWALQRRWSTCQINHLWQNIWMNPILNILFIMFFKTITKNIFEQNHTESHRWKAI